MLKGFRKFRYDLYQFQKSLTEDYGNVFAREITSYLKKLYYDKKSKEWINGVKYGGLTALIAATWGVFIDKADSLEKVIIGSSIGGASVLTSAIVYQTFRNRALQDKITKIMYDTLSSKKDINTIINNLAENVLKNFNYETDELMKLKKRVRKIKPHYFKLDH